MTSLALASEQCFGLANVQRSVLASLFSHHHRCRYHVQVFTQICCTAVKSEPLRTELTLGLLAIFVLCKIVPNIRLEEAEESAE